MRVGSKMTKTLAAALMLGAAIGPASAITSNTFEYTNPKQGYLTMHPMSFYPDGSSSGSQTWFVSWNGANLTGDGCFMAPANLPNNVEINELVLWTSTTSSIFYNFTGVTLSSGSASSIASSSIVDGTGNRKATVIPISGQLVKGTRAFGLGVCLDSSGSDTFYGARIGYTYTNAGD